MSFNRNKVWITVLDNSVECYIWFAFCMISAWPSEMEERRAKRQKWLCLNCSYVSSPNTILWVVGYQGSPEASHHLWACKAVQSLGMPVLAQTPACTQTSTCTQTPMCTQTPDDRVKFCFHLSHRNVSFSKPKVSLSMALNSSFCVHTVLCSI